MSDLVFLGADNQIMTNSLTVAKVFEKEHKNVLQSLRELMASLDKNFIELNFQLNEYKDSIGRSLPMYDLTRDGFSLLVMGFTGEKALQWKVKYIEAFNAMEAELLRQSEKEVSKTIKSSLADRTPLILAIYAAAKIEGNQLALALDRIHLREGGYSVLKEAEVQLIAPQQQQLYTPTEIGKSIEPPCSGVKVNKYLENMGWQIKVNKQWEAIGVGEQYAVYLDTGKAHSTGTPIRQMKWTANTIFAVQEYLNS